MLTRMCWRNATDTLLSLISAAQILRAFNTWCPCVLAVPSVGCAVGGKCSYASSSSFLFAARRGENWIILVCNSAERLTTCPCCGQAGEAVARQRHLSLDTHLIPPPAAFLPGLQAGMCCQLKPGWDFWKRALYSKGKQMHPLPLPSQFQFLFCFLSSEAKEGGASLPSRVGLPLSDCCL